MFLRFGEQFYPVIHVVDDVQALRNVRIAFENGAHGVFLINHEFSAQTLLGVYQAVRSVFPNRWIGLNFLDLDPLQALTVVPQDANALWVDSVRINLAAEDPVQHARRYDLFRRSTGIRWRGELFGGVAFKYQPQNGDPAREAELAAPFVDVITTSGSGTGSAPDIEKIHLMRFATPLKPLAIASGMTPENVRDFIPLASKFLVATGISDSHTELNPARVRAFADAVTAYTLELYDLQS